MLEDTSFAIHPGKENQSGTVIYRDIGKILSHEVIENKYLFTCENGKVGIQFYTDSIVRILLNQQEEPHLNQSQTVVATPDEVVVTEDFSQEILSLKTNKLELLIKKEPFRLTVRDDQGHILVSEGDRGMAFRENGEVSVFKEMHKDDHFYGFGEKSGFLDKRGEKYEMWNTDVYAPHNPETDPLYESIPYFMTLRNGHAHGIFFDNTFRTTFDMKSDAENYSFAAEGGQIDYYVMAGPEPKSVLEQYTHITGRMPIPPK